MTHLTRREFITITLASLLAGRAVARAAALPYSSDPALHSADETPAFQSGQPEDLIPTCEECPECRGLGAITCPGCDGTRMWTEASESAGFYQREAARTTGHCAWCDEWGHVTCQACDGTGSML